MKKAVSIILALMMITAIIAGCSSNNGNKEIESKKSSESSLSTDSKKDDETEGDYDKLIIRKYDGTDYTILIPVNYEGGVENDLFGDPEGDTVNVALYNRQCAVEEKLDVNIKCDEQPGGWPEREMFMNLITEEVQSGTGRWELISGYAAYITSLTSQGCFMNWNDVPDINLEADWWFSDITEQMSVNDTLYFITGDLSLNSIKRLFCLFFDKDMMTDLQLEFPYDSVKNGNWTLDRFYTYVSTASKDLNNDGLFDPANDRLGLVVNAGYQISGFETSFGVEVCKKDKDGFPEVTIFDNSVYVDKFLKLYSLINETPGVVIGGGDSFRIMENDHALFVSFVLGGTEYLRNYDVNYGVLPFPKYNEEQKTYRTGSSDAFNMFCIPANANDLSFIAVVTDNLAAENQKTVIPAYYDINLKNRLLDIFDSDSAEMVDLLRKTSSYDFGIVNSVHCGDIAGIWGLLIEWKNNNISSYLESQKDNIETLFSDFIDKSYYKD